MPQLNLFWFFSKFLLAWGLLFIFLLCLMKTFNKNKTNLIKEKSNEENKTLKKKWMW